MAPSRATVALLRLHRITPRTIPRLLSTCSAQRRTYTPHWRYSAALRPAISIPSLARARRTYSTTVEPPDYLNEAELHIFNKVKTELEPVRLEVQDISGGCGSMYALEIESPRFKGLSVVKQHKLVNEVLREEIKGWHGVQLRTKAV